MRSSLLLLPLFCYVLFLCVWRIDAKIRSSPSSSSMPSGQPTTDQLVWSSEELGMLIHFNMATFLDVKYDGCNADPNLVPSVNLFNPSLINLDQWMDAIEAFGAKYAVLVAKHNCGFALWNTDAMIPSLGVPYGYSIAESPMKVDVVQQFINAAKKRGIKTGFYYSVVVNNYLRVINGKVQAGTPQPGQLNITQNDYESIITQMLKELWTNYGELNEIWLDGGYTADMKQSLMDMIASLQPHSAVFNGQGLTKNQVRWIGTEDGDAPYDNWSTGDSEGGDADSSSFDPAECDTTLQVNDRWFYGDGVGLRSLKELIDVYHNTVGHNCQLMLDLSPDRLGLIHSDHFARYKQLGDFIRSCYQTPPVQNIAIQHEQGLSFTLSYPYPAAIDRVVLQENQSNGQFIRSYNITGLVIDYTSGKSIWQLLSNGKSVGNKRIHLFQSVTVQAVKLDVFTPFESAPRIKYFAAYLCDALL